MSTLQSIILITVFAGSISVVAAASLSLTFLAKMVNHMVSVSVGILLSTALLHSLPEAFSQSNANPQALFATLLAGLLGFFFLEKLVASGKQIIAFDINEVAPGDDEWDANVAARLLYRIANLVMTSQGK